jgi:hypothetical protein
MIQGSDLVAYLQTNIEGNIPEEQIAKPASMAGFLFFRHKLSYRYNIQNNLAVFQGGCLAGCATSAVSNAMHGCTGFLNS